MANRYSQIKKGLEYETALTTYVDYLKNPANRTTKRMTGGQRGARRNVVPAALKPFGMELAAADYVQVTVSNDALTVIGGQIGTRLFTSGANLTNSSKLGKFKPARANVFRGPGTASYVQSKVTKLWYLKYAGDSYSAPFGAIAATEEEQVGSRIVKAALLTAGSASDINRVSISPEKVPV